MKQKERRTLPMSSAKGCMASWAPMRLPVLQVVLELQQQRQQQQQQQGPATCISQLPLEVLRMVAQNLVHADIEQARLVCRAWRRAFADATVTDMYMAMCADVKRSKQLVKGFTQSFSFWNHLHFWVPGSAVRVLMGTDGGTFQQYMCLFAGGKLLGTDAAAPEGLQASWLLQPKQVSALTLHYLDDRVCQLSFLTQLSFLSKLELVDLVPCTASMSPLAALPKLSHLVVEYKDSSTSYHADGASKVEMPDLASFSSLTQLRVLEITLASSVSTHLQTCFASDDMGREELRGLFGSLGEFGGRPSAVDAAESAASHSQNSGATSTDSSSGEAAVGQVADTVEACAASDVEDLAAAYAAADSIPAAGDGPGAEQDLQAASGAGSSSADRSILSALSTTHLAPAAASDADPQGLMFAGLLACSSGAAAAAAVTLSSAAVVREVVQRGRPGMPPLSSTLMTGGDFIVILLGRAWRGLMNLRHLDVRNAPCGMAVRHKQLLAALPSLTELKLTGQDTRLREMYGPSAPSFKLELARDELSHMWGPLGLSVALHCPNTPALKANMQALVSLAEPPQKQSQSSAATSAASSPAASPLASSRSRNSAAAGSPAQETVETPSAASSARAAKDAAASHVPASAAAAVATGSEAGTTTLNSLHLFVENPDHFKALKQLRKLGRNAVKELSLTVCWSLNEDADSTGVLEEEEDAEEEEAPADLMVAPPAMLQGAAAAAPGPAAQGQLAAEIDAAAGAGHAGGVGSVDDGQGSEAGGGPAASQAAAASQPLPALAAGPAGLPGATSLSAAGSSAGGMLIGSDAGVGDESVTDDQIPSPALAPSTGGELGPTHYSTMQCRLSPMSDLEGVDEGESVTAPPSPLHASMASTSCSHPSPTSTLSGLPSPGPASPPHTSSRSLPISTLCFGAADQPEEEGQPMAGSCLEVTDSQAGDSSASEHATAAMAQMPTPTSSSAAAQAVSSQPSDPAAAGSVPAEAAPAPAAVPATSLAAAAPMTALNPAAAPFVPSTASAASGLGPATAPPAAAPAAGLATAAAPIAQAMAHLAVGTGAAGAVPAAGSAGAAGAGAAAQASARDPRTSALCEALGPRHVLPPLRRLRGLSALTLREINPPGMVEDEDGGVPQSRPEMGLCPAALQLMARSFSGLTRLEFQGALAAPHPNHLHHLSLLTRLRSLSLAPNADDPTARLGMHCLPSSLTALTLQSMSLAAAPLKRAGDQVAHGSSSGSSGNSSGRSKGGSVSSQGKLAGAGSRLPHLSHLHLKNCSLPTLATFACAPNIEWLHLDNCEACVYLSEVVTLWADSLSWLEITYTHRDWQLMSEPSEIAALRELRRLRKLSLVSPYEEGLGADELLGLTQLRLLSLSPGPALGGRAAILSLAGHGFLAGLELKLYSDVPHHEELCGVAASVHAQLQEALPMTDVLVLVDDEYVDDHTQPAPTAADPAPADPAAVENAAPAAAAAGPAPAADPAAAENAGPDPLAGPDPAPAAADDAGPEPGPAAAGNVQPDGPAGPGPAAGQSDILATIEGAPAAAAVPQDGGVVAVGADAALEAAGAGPSVQAPAGDAGAPAPASGPLPVVADTEQGPQLPGASDAGPVVEAEGLAGAVPEASEAPAPAPAPSIAAGPVAPTPTPAAP